jgi:hypothetical protein
MTGLLTKHQQRKHCHNSSTDGDVKHSIQWEGAVWLRKMAEIKEAMPHFTHFMAEVV